MTQPDVPTTVAPVRQFAKFDFSKGVQLLPVISEQAGHIRPVMGVVLSYEQPQPVLEAHFQSASTYDHDSFPNEIMRPIDDGFYKVGEEHDLASLQELIQQDHPQTKELASVYQSLASKLYGHVAKANLALA